MTRLTGQFQSLRIRWDGEYRGINTPAVNGD